MVMNLPTAISSTTTALAAARRAPGGSGAAGEGAEHELGHRHVRRCVHPLPGHVAQNHREPVLAEREKVVHVAADLEARR